jgi:uncharacterized protein YndB with AHSA1/START domain
MTKVEHYDLVLERTLDAPRDLVWRAWTDPEHLKKWWAPRPYETIECVMELRPGGTFSFRMTGPDGFDSIEQGCFLDIVEREKLVWTTALLADFRPAPAQAEGCAGLAMTAVITFDDAGEGRTRYRAVAMHRNEADRDAHEQMGFHDGWGTVAGQLEEVARSLGETA